MSTSLIIILFFVFIVLPYIGGYLYLRKSDGKVSETQMAERRKEAVTIVRVPTVIFFLLVTLYVIVALSSENAQTVYARPFDAYLLG